MKKRLISLLMALAVVAFSFCVPFTASAATAEAVPDLEDNESVSGGVPAALTKLGVFLAGILGNEIKEELNFHSVFGLDREFNEYLVYLNNGRLVLCSECNYYYDPTTDLVYQPDPVANDYQEYRCLSHSRMHQLADNLSAAYDEASEIDTLAEIPLNGQILSDVITRLQNQYAPSEATEFVSMQKSSNKLLNDKTTASLYFPFLEGGEIWGHEITKPVYFNIYYVDENGSLWINEIQNAVYAAIDETDSKVYLYYDSFTTDLISSERTYQYQKKQMREYASTDYYYLRHGSDFIFKLFRCANAADYLNISTVGGGFTFGAGNKYISSDSADASSTIRIYSEFTGVPYNTRSEYLPLDWGFYISDEPIVFEGMYKDIDPEKIDPDGIITPTGDNVYNWTITNNTTGDTNTITEYINNNYTYIINNYYDDDDTGEAGGGGSLSGDVDVGGTVKVDGDIGVNGDIDVNIDVNVKSESDSSEPQMPVEISVDDYLTPLPEQSQGIMKIIGDFFAAVPDELMNLILAGVAVAIILRIWGR